MRRLFENHKSSIKRGQRRGGVAKEVYRCASSHTKHVRRPRVFGSGIRLTLDFSFETKDRVVFDFPSAGGVLPKYRQPDRVVSQQDRSAPDARLEPNKTSSSFIDNKNLDYGNQGPGLRQARKVLRELLDRSHFFWV
ncbi:GL11452 [Drosophila persimilis]|uniref:GL11452 n=1 Tax=Drosophila persimilis TaxID=7234 RepID=B4GAW5_DROPE|nr:GL11452 [Drosophila persimilis]